MPEGKKDKPEKYVKKNNGGRIAGGNGGSQRSNLSRPTHNYYPPEAIQRPMTGKDDKKDK
jgi:hypothetical protein